MGRWIDLALRWCVGQVIAFRLDTDLKRCQNPANTRTQKVPRPGPETPYRSGPEFEPSPIRFEQSLRSNSSAQNANDPIQHDAVIARSRLSPLQSRLHPHGIYGGANHKFAIRFSNV
eukprot:221069-Amorphochlora_amoeboformis.AAC.1